MTNRKPYPILSALRREGDTATLGALRLWRTDYHEGPPQVAANDNDPTANPTTIETRIDALSAEALVVIYDAELNPDPEANEPPIPYSAKLHRERFERVKHAKKSPPPPEDVDAEAEMARFIDAKKMREWLGSDAETLDMAIGPYTYRDVGRRVGATGSDDTLERTGKTEVKDVARLFWDEAA